MAGRYDERMSAETDVGVRELKKRATLLALHESAVSLISERGYDAATVADIATAAGVSPRTFFSYYSSKEAALYAPVSALVDRLAEHLRAAADAGDTFAALRSWVDAELVRGEPAATRAIAVIGAAAVDSDSVASFGLRVLDRITGAIAGSLATDLETEPDNPVVAMTASALGAALGSIGPLAVHASVPRAKRAEYLELAFTFAQAGLAAVGRP